MTTTQIENQIEVLSAFAFAKYGEKAIEMIENNLPQILLDWFEHACEIKEQIHKHSAQIGDSVYKKLNP